VGFIGVDDIFGFINQFWLALQLGQTPTENIWVYLILVIMVMIEGPVSILLAAGASSIGLLNPLFVFIAATLGDLIADGLWYALGYYGKIDWVLHRRGWFGVEAGKLDILKRVIERHFVKITLFAKITNGLIVPVLIATGVARVGWKRWFPLLLVLNLLNSLIMVLLGYYLASSLIKIQEGFRYAGIAFSVVFLLVGSIYLRHYLSRTDVMEKLEADRL
jgi:membrane protein DedA with SNARE-associated domain